MISLENNPVLVILEKCGTTFGKPARWQICPFLTVRLPKKYIQLLICIASKNANYFSHLSLF
jgi:hypothetical protein